MHSIGQTIILYAHTQLNLSLLNDSSRMAKRDQMMVEIGS